MSGTTGQISRRDSPAIDDYALIGNGRTAALISRFGSVDWLSFPRFDSESLFGALLDPDKGGTFTIRPAGDFESTRRYLPNTNVIETRLRTSTGSLCLLDCMSVAGKAALRSELHPENELLRFARCDSGELTVEILFAPRPSYGRRTVRLNAVNSRDLMLDLGDSAVCLRGSVPLDLNSDTAHAQVTLRAGETLEFSLTHALDAPMVLPPLGDRTRAAIDETIAWWRQWTRRLTYDGPHRDAVIRSVLVLKLLFYSPSGAVLAAPTTSLPERIGGDLNWDYRYCWLRDASFTVRALYELGCGEEARGFIDWLLHATQITRPELRVLYDVYGRLPGHEEELSHWSGYRGSQPVRVGNLAAHQLQLDVYGQVIDAVTHLAGAEDVLDRETRGLLSDYGEYVCRNWEKPDNGIWEIRGAPQHFTQSKALCWTALDRLLRLHDRGLLTKLPLELFRKNHKLLQEAIKQHGWNEQLQSYTGIFDSEDFDTSTLLLIWYGFAAPSSTRARATVQAVNKHLGAGGGLVYRNRDYTEGAFAACSFWIAELLARGAGTLDEAEQLFDRMCGYSNDIGLFAEEIDPATGAALGNFPQAYTHVGLINAALSIKDRRQKEESKQSGGSP